MDSRRISDNALKQSAAAADAAAAVAAIASGAPVQQVNDKWIPSFENRRSSAEALKMTQESCNW